jgi:hypothetical protein
MKIIIFNIIQILVQTERSNLIKNCDLNTVYAVMIKFHEFF